MKFDLDFSILQMHCKHTSGSRQNGKQGRQGRLHDCNNQVGNTYCSMSLLQDIRDVGKGMAHTKSMQTRYISLHAFHIPRKSM